MMRNIYFIPLRKGSKSIKNKNFKLFYGKPLFSWCIDAVIGSKTNDEIWIATDSIQVERIAQRAYHAVNIYRRKRENATDISPSIDVVLEFLNANKFDKDDNLILVQATSPLTSSNDFIKLNEAIQKKNRDSFISCTRLKKFRWSDDGISLDYDLDNKPRRQDYKGFLIESGAFYCSKIENILNSGKLISGRIGIIELGNEAIIDIDEPVDWKIGEAYLRHIKKGNE